MPLLSFSKLYHKLVNGTKLQTIRKPRKNPIKVGDPLYIYWKLRTEETLYLGKARVISIVRKRFGQITEGEFIADGFTNKGEALKAFFSMYADLSFQDPFDIICFQWIEKNEILFHS
jgi:hypothetical protein